MAEPTSATPFFRRVLREPTFHFVLLAAALFAANATLESWRGDVIRVDRVQIAVRIAELEAMRGSPLSPEERQLVEDAYVDERILVREALALGLERDRRIDDVLVQKMLHVLSGDVIQPTEDELRGVLRGEPGALHARADAYRRGDRHRHGLAGNGRLVGSAAGRRAHSATRRKP